MDTAREELLSRSRFANQEHGNATTRGNLGREGDDLANDQTVANNV
jgi:hypothetical protein